MLPLCLLHFKLSLAGRPKIHHSVSPFQHLLFLKCCSLSFTCVCLCVCAQRSRSAFSLTSDDSPEKNTEALVGAGGVGGVQDYASLKKETARASSLPSWKSVDRLDNSSK